VSMRTSIGLDTRMPLVSIGPRLGCPLSGAFVGGGEGYRAGSERCWRLSY
jgi:hypothetical protein